MSVGERITMLPMIGIPDVELALDMVMDALRKKADGGADVSLESRRRARPQSRASLEAERDALVVELAEAKLARLPVLP